MRWVGHSELAQAFLIAPKRTFARRRRLYSIFGHAAAMTPLTAKFAIKNIKTEADLKKIFSVLTVACHMSGGCQIEACYPMLVAAVSSRSLLKS
jgi:hypothetical protein